MAYRLLPDILKSTRARIDSLINDSSVVFPSAVLGDLMRLKEYIVPLSKVISGAEKEITGVGVVSLDLWLIQLKEVTYCGQDLVDEFGYELLRAKVVFNNDLAKRKLLQLKIGGSKLMEPPLPVSELVISGDLTGRLKELLANFHEISEHSERPMFRELWGSERGDDTLIESETSLLTTTCIFGRNQEKEQLTEFLLSRDPSIDAVSVLAIVGQAGVGKTALAQLVYNDPIISRNFDFRAWVNVSERFCVTTITRNILESFRKKECFLKDQTRLQRELVRDLMGKSYFIVIDDLRHENKPLWERFLAPFLYAQSGKIIITTQSTSTAEVVQTMPQFNLGLLNFENCWSMFEKCAFRFLDANSQGSLLERGRRIVARCGGIPLFVKAVASALKIENEQKWVDMLEFFLDDLSSPSKVIYAPLITCYECMPVTLKQCFLFLAIYPNGHVFFKDDLIKLWMSVGLLEEEGKEPLDVGSLVFNELLERAIFEPAQLGLYGRNNAFLVHDLIHDFARSFAGSEFAVVKHDRLHDISTNIRYLSVIVPDLREIVNLQPLEKCIHLRVLQILNQRGIWKYDGAKTEIPNKLFGQMKFLRSLILREMNIATLPYSIGSLKLLRYIDLASTLIREIPGSIGDLYYLQVLELTKCPLKVLPIGIKNLINLQILNFHKSFSLVMPVGIENLLNLKTLPRFDVRRENRHAALSELNDMVNLSGDLIIAGLGNRTNDHESDEINLQNKTRLQALTLDWSSGISRPSDIGCTSAGVDSNHDELVLERLKPHTNLRELHILNYNGSKFPSWLGDSSFTRLVNLSLVGCNKCVTLPMLGQIPYLRNLSIRSLSNVLFVRREFCSNDDTIKGFQSLETLEFVDMVKWRDWSGVNKGEFCSLRALKLIDCPMLMFIPEPLCSSMVKLVIKDCGILVSRFSLPFTRTMKLNRNISRDMFPCFDMPFLTTLKFSHLRNIISLPLNPTKLPWLQRLEIHGCRNLETVGGINGLRSLKIFEISACQNLQFSMNEEFPETLVRLGISSCPKLLSWKRSHEIKYYAQLHMHGDVIIEEPKLPVTSQAFANSIENDPAHKSKEQIDEDKYYDQVQTHAHTEDYKRKKPAHSW